MVDCIGKIEKAPAHGQQELKALAGAAIAVYELLLGEDAQQKSPRQSLAPRYSGTRQLLVYMSVLDGCSQELSYGIPVLEPPCGGVRPGHGPRACRDADFGAPRTDYFQRKPADHHGKQEDVLAM